MIASRWIAAIVAWPLVCGALAAGEPSSLRDGAATPAEVQAVAAKAELSFAAQVAPVLVENCLGCHGSKRASAGLSLANFEALKAGGQSGELFDASDVQESLLIQKLSGTAADGQRMPLRRAALSAETIALISRWIQASAPYDGGDPKLPLEQLVNITLAKTLSAGELAARRLGNARERFRLALPDRSLAEVETAQFHVLGDAAAETLRTVGSRLQSQWPKVAKQLGVHQLAGPVDGRTMILVIQRSVDFGEFVRMVYKQEPQRGQAVVWHYDHLDAYAAIAVGKGEDAALTDLLTAEALAGLYLATQAPGPDWLARGVARAVAAKLEPKAAPVRSWEDQLARTLADRPTAEAILAGKLSLADAEAVGYAVGKALLKSPKKLPALWRLLTANEPLDEALQAATGGSLTQLLEQTPSPGRGKRKR